MTTKTREYYINKFLTDFSGFLATRNSDNLLTIKDDDVERGPYPVPDIIPSPKIYLWEMPDEQVTRSNKYNLRKLNLSIECFFNPKKYWNTLNTRNSQVVANQFLRQLQLAANNCLFSKNPVVEIGNSIIGGVPDASSMAVQIVVEVNYATDY